MRRGRRNRGHGGNGRNGRSVATRGSAVGFEKVEIVTAGIRTLACA